MTSRYLSLVLYVIGAALFISWFLVARGRGRSKAGGGAVDQDRRNRMSLILGAGFVALIAGAAVSCFR